MALVVDEIMNRELFSLRPTDDVETATGHVLALGISGAPVIDVRGHLLGMVSWRDLVAHRGGRTVAERMSSPAITLRSSASLLEAARLLCEQDLHRAPVVDAEGRAVGMLSSLDVLKAQLGLPVGHPTTFPHFDRSTGLTWTNDLDVETAQLEAAPSGPGVLVLIRGGAGVPEEIVRTEWCPNVRTRLRDIISRPEGEPSGLSRLLRMGSLRFRAAGTDGMR